MKEGKLLEKKLARKIEKLRAEMIKLSDQYGMDHPKVLDISRKIDLLHTELVKIQMEKQYKQKGKNNNNRLFEKSFNLEYASTF